MTPVSGAVFFLYAISFSPSLSFEVPCQDGKDGEEKPSGQSTKEAGATEEAPAKSSGVRDDRNTHGVLELSHTQVVVTRDVGVSVGRITLELDGDLGPDGELDTTGSDDLRHGAVSISDSATAEHTTGPICSSVSRRNQARGVDIDSGEASGEALTLSGNHLLGGGDKLERASLTPEAVLEIGELDRVENTQERSRDRVLLQSEDGIEEVVHAEVYPRGSDGIREVVHEVTEELLPAHPSGAHHILSQALDIKAHGVREAGQIGDGTAESLTGDRNRLAGVRESGVRDGGGLCSDGSHAIVSVQADQRDIQSGGATASQVSHVHHSGVAHEAEAVSEEELHFLMEDSGDSEVAG
jgi:hypothetical protein